MANHPNRSMRDKVKLVLDRNQAATVGLVLLNRAQELEAEIADARMHKWPQTELEQRWRDDARTLRDLAQAISTQLKEMLNRDQPTPEL